MAEAVSQQSVGRIIRAHASHVARAPIERVYEAWVDPLLMARWMDVKAIIGASGPLDRPGTRFRVVVYGPYRPRGEVLAAEPPVLHEMGGGSVFRIEWRWAARFSDRDGGTEITLDEEVTFPAGLFSGFLRRTQDGGRMELAAVQRLATFVEVVEAGNTKEP